MLGWLVACGKFPLDWWAPRLAEAIRLSAGSDDDYIPLEEMMREVASASTLYPHMALDVLELVVKQDRFERHRRYLEAASQIVTVGMEHSSLAHRARTIADRLARAGIDEFEQFSLGSRY